MQQRRWVIQFRAKNKPTFTWALKTFTYPKNASPTHASGTTVMHQLVNVVATLAHPKEPFARNRAQFGRMSDLASQIIAEPAPWAAWEWLC